VETHNAAQIAPFNDTTSKSGSFADDKGATSKPGKAGITIVIHAYDGVIRSLAWAPLKAEFEKRGYLVMIVQSPKANTKTPNQDRAQVMLEALKNVKGDIVLVGVSNEGLFMPLVAADRPIRRIVMLNAVVPTPVVQAGIRFRDSLRNAVYPPACTASPRHVRGLSAQGIAEG